MEKSKRNDDDSNEQVSRRSDGKIFLRASFVRGTATARRATVRAFKRHYLRLKRTRLSAVRLGFRANSLFRDTTFPPCWETTDCPADDQRSNRDANKKNRRRFWIDCFVHVAGIPCRLYYRSLPRSVDYTVRVFVRRNVTDGMYFENYRRSRSPYIIVIRCTRTIRVAVEIR